MGSNGPKRQSLRLFVALDPPEAVAREVCAWAREVAGRDQRMRPVPARHCHITMAFLGEVPESAAGPIGEVVEESAGAVSGLSLGAPAWLPPRRPRALALDVHDDSGELEACRARLAAALEAAVGWREKRRFRPHMTAARLGRGVNPGEHHLPASPALTFAGEHLTLYLSRLLPDGAQYEALVSADL